MNVNNVLAILMMLIAGILLLFAIALFLFIPFATEIEDVLGPLVGGLICFASAAALVLDAQEFLNYRILSKVPKIVLHLANAIAILSICVLAVPSLLQDVVYRFETRALLFVGLAIVTAYILAAKMRHTGRPWF
jgi:hypothetical protein